MDISVNYMKNHISGYLDDEIQHGPLYIKRYYDSIYKPYPDWLSYRYEDLPRVKQPLTSLSYRVHFKVIISSQQKGEKFDWIIRELKGEWFNDDFLTYYFELEEDAVAFKLRWA